MALWRKATADFTALALRQSSMETQAMTALCFGVGVTASHHKYLRDIAGHRFLLMAFPVFVARSSSYMGAISTATSVFFAVQWDKEDADIELKPAKLHEVSPPVKALGLTEIEFVRKLMNSEQGLNRGEASA